MAISKRWLLKLPRLSKNKIKARPAAVTETRQRRAYAQSSSASAPAKSQYADGPSTCAQSTNLFQG
jgi:hypothetical protein